MQRNVAVIFACAAARSGGGAHKNPTIAAFTADIRGKYTAAFLFAIY